MVLFKRRLDRKVAKLTYLGKVRVLQSIASNCEKSAAQAQGAENGRFCMGILVTLSLSKKKAPIGLKIFFSS